MNTTSEIQGLAISRRRKRRAAVGYMTTVAMIVAVVLLIWIPAPLPATELAAPSDPLFDGFALLIRGALTIGFVAVALIVAFAITRWQRTA